MGGVRWLVNCLPMFTRSLHRRITAWLAALAVLWGALLPVLSHAVVAHQTGDNAWVEVCTATGMAWVNSTDNEATPDVGSPAKGMNMAVCGWCATHSPLASLPTVAQPLATPLAFGPQVPVAFLQAPRPLFVWAAAQSRAPPVSA